MMIELIAMCVLSAGAGDWPQFRGPNSDGHAVGPATPVEWSETKNVAWKVSIPGLGWSSPVVVDGKTGDRHWMERIEGNYSASPISANGRVLFLNETGLATWVKADKKFAVRGTNELPGRTFATPAFVDGAMYLRTDATLYKFAQ